MQLIHVPRLQTGLNILYRAPLTCINRPYRSKDDSEKICKKRYIFVLIPKFFVLILKVGFILMTDY